MRVHVAATADHVRAEAERRILARFPLWRQLNLDREGGPAQAEMAAWINAVRAASNKLETLPEIPADYRDDRHWPE